MWSFDKAVCFGLGEKGGRGQGLFLHGFLLVGLGFWFFFVRMKSASSSPKLFFKKVLLNSCFQALLFQDEMFHRSFLYKYKSKELFSYFINLDYIDKIFVVCSKTLQL